MKQFPHGAQSDATELHKLRLAMPVIEHEITNLLANIYINNPELKNDDTFKSDILEGSTDYMDIINKCLLELSITEGYIEGIKISRARMDDRISKHTVRVNLIRTLLRRMLEMADMRTVKAANGTVSLSQKPLSVQILDEGLIPDEFMRIKVEPNKTLIGEKLKAGEDVPGATLSNGGETLTVR
jgi:hypothetical protein